MDGITTTLKCTALVAALLLALPSSADAKKKHNGTCPVPDGVKCMSLQDVYKRTENSDRVTPQDVDSKAEPTKQPHSPQPSVPTLQASNPQPQKGPIAYRPVKHADAVVQGDTLAVVAPVPAVPTRAPTLANQMYRPPSSDPVRAPAKVMRILVNAWEDDGGSLHMPGTIFTEVEPRRWSVGAKSSTEATGFRLLEGLGDKAAKDSQASASSANAVSNRPGS